eukprot:m.95478 g.95478  ORF g.95478 m.95478 type:complete len:322 (-) comp13493_c0_seq1:121-1086(-)
MGRFMNKRRQSRDARKDSTSSESEGKQNNVLTSPPQYANFQPARGSGIYNNIPSDLVGCIKMPVSLHEYSNVGATEIIREGIRRVTLDSKIRKKERIKRKGAAKKYQFGSTKVFNIKIDMSVSASGVILAPLSKAIQDTSSFKFHKMKQVSHVAAGNHANYDMLGFVAKSEFKERFLYVIDCGETIDYAKNTFESSLKQAVQDAKLGNVKLGSTYSLLGGRSDPEYSEINSPTYDTISPNISKHKGRVEYASLDAVYASPSDAVEPRYNSLAEITNKRKQTGECLYSVPQKMGSKKRLSQFDLEEYKPELRKKSRLSVEMS